MANLSNQYQADRGAAGPIPSPGLSLVGPVAGGGAGECVQPGRGAGSQQGLHRRHCTGKGGPWTTRLRIRSRVFGLGRAEIGGGSCWMDPSGAQVSVSVWEPGVDPPS